MRLVLRAESYVVLDLDDTLYAEVDFVASGFHNIAAELDPTAGVDLFDQMWARYAAGLEVFSWVAKRYPSRDLTVDDLVRHYRCHHPAIRLGAGVSAFLDRLRELGVPLGLVTDGRTVTQRNKLHALGIEDRFDHIVISEELGSEKPDPRNFLPFEERFPGGCFHFFGDNTSKDFVVPARLGWETFCLVDTGRHIHPQTIDAAPRPDHVLSSFEDLEVSCSWGCSPSAS